MRCAIGKLLYAKAILILVASTLSAQCNGWTPGDLDNKLLWVESTFWTQGGGYLRQLNDRCVSNSYPFDCCTGPGAGTCPDNRGRTVATCSSQGCYDRDSELSRIEQKYCDMEGGTAFGRRELWSEGCVAYWEDWSGATSGSPACHCSSGDYKCCTGREFGMDDLEKPGFISNCVNGLPCARMWPCDGADCDKPLDSGFFPQNTTLEIDTADQGDLDLGGSFSLVVLWRPPEDYTQPPWNVQTDPRFIAGGTNNSGMRLILPEYSVAMVRSGGGPTVIASNEKAITPGSWNLVEMYFDDTGIRFGEDEVHVWVNHKDSTRQPVARYTSGLYFRAAEFPSRAKSSANGMGDIAAILFTKDVLSDSEQANLQCYLNSIYSYIPIHSSNFERGDLSDWSFSAW